MKLYRTTRNDAIEEWSGAHAWEYVYLAAEVDAEMADMRAGFALELASKNARIAELETLVVPRVSL